MAKKCFQCGKPITEGVDQYIDINGESIHYVCFKEAAFHIVREQEGIDINDILDHIMITNMQVDPETGKTIKGGYVFIPDNDDDMEVEMVENDDFPNEIGKRYDAKMAEECMTPSLLVEKLDKIIIGQDRAKRLLSVAVANHYKRIKRLSNLDAYAHSDVDMESSNVLMVGPSGCGKTAIIKALAKMINVPLAIVDASGLTEAGYVGADVDTIIMKLYNNAGQDVKKTEQGIVFIDEFDKLARKSGANASITADPGREGVQQALLKVIEGTELQLSMSLQKSKRVHPDAPTVKVDTSNILFICGGAFEGIEKIISKRVNKAKPMGFNSKEIEKNLLTSYNDLVPLVTPEDIISYGMIPEIVGRLPVLSYLYQLTEEQLMEIITEPKNAILRQYDELFSMDRTRLYITNDALRKIANLAIKQKTGARALRTIMEPLLLDAMYEIRDRISKDQTICNVVLMVDNNEFKIVWSNYRDLTKYISQEDIDFIVENRRKYSTYEDDRNYELSCDEAKEADERYWKMISDANEGNDLYDC